MWVDVFFQQKNSDYWIIFTIYKKYCQQRNVNCWPCMLGAILCVVGARANFNLVYL